MTAPPPEGRVAPREPCPSCRGPWIDGNIAMPIVDSLRFAYRLGTHDVTTTVAARMCRDCGRVELRGRVPDLLIRRNRPTSGRVGPPRRWALNVDRPSPVYRSRYGRGPTG